MLRFAPIAGLVLANFLVSLPASAQRNPAPITRGQTSGELAMTTEELRATNAAINARLAGLEADRAALNGQVETLEFLLSQTRDQINSMQEDDAEIARLVRSLEERLEAKDQKIRSMEKRIASLESGAAGLDFSARDLGDTTDVEALDARSSGADELADVVEDVDVRERGPVRISRRLETDGAGDEAQDDGLPQGSLGTLSASELPGEAGPLFAEAKTRLLQFDYAGAEEAFRAFLDRFSDDPQAGQAQYWLGEVLYQQEAYAESGVAYTQMIRQYPDDPRAPEALAKLARSMRLVGDTERACSALDLLPQRYPNASGVTKNLAAGERVRSGCDS